MKNQATQLTHQALKSYYRLLTAGFIFIVALGFSASGEASPVKPRSKVPDALIEPGPGKDRFILVVEKAEQKLHLYEFKKGNYYLHSIMDCSTGENTGDKMVEGDKKTPEGFYIFNKKAVESELAPIYGVLAYPMDYPNFWDKVSNRAGSGIWMHGTNKKLAPLDSNGCVELKNIDIMNLEGLIDLYRTPIVVYHKIAYNSTEEMNREAAELKSFIEAWRRAWETKDFKAYKAKYAKDFVSNDGKSYTAWMDHKSNLNHKYEKIEVDIADLKIYRHRNVIVASFEQYYKANNHFTSDGVKRLYISDNGGSYRIAAEEWHPFPPRPPRKLLSAEVKARVMAEEKTAPVVVASVKQTPAVQQQKQTAPDKPVAVSPPKPEKKVAKKEAKPTAPKINKQLAAESDNIRKIVKQWLNAWRGMDVDNYLVHYHPEFKYKGMDLNGYREYKQGLAEKYNSITIKVEKMDIQVQGTRAMVTFVQDYRSDKYRDYGLKTLVLKKHKKDWRIKEESWKDMSAGAKP